MEFLPLGAILPLGGLECVITHAECAGVSGPGYYAAGPRPDVQDVPVKPQPSFMSRGMRRRGQVIFRRDGRAGVSGAAEWVFWRWRAGCGRDLAGRARIVRRGRGRWVAARRRRSMMAWSGALRARRCRALRTAGGRDWPSACARRRAAVRTGPVPRRRSAGAMRRTGRACRSPTGLLRPAGRLRPRSRGGVCPRPLRGTRPWPCRAGLDLLAGELRRDGRGSQRGSSAAGSPSSRRAHSRSSAEGTYSSPSSPARSWRSASASWPSA